MDRDDEPTLEKGKVCQDFSHKMSLRHTDRRCESSCDFHSILLF